MAKPLLFTLFTLTSTLSYTQEIKGKITNNSPSVKNIHVINISSNKATITNEKGEFKIKAKLQDTLLFSAIQFQKELIVINTTNLIKGKIQVKLNPKIIFLEEVSIKNHSLSGNLKNDIEEYKLENYADAFTLNLPNAGKSSKTELDRIHIRFNQYSGITGSLYGWISGKRKRLEKIEKLAVEDFYLEKIRAFIKDDNFVHLMYIPKDKINLFLEFCKSKNIVELYKKKEKNKLINLLISESSVFLEIIKNGKE